MQKAVINSQHSFPSALRLTRKPDFEQVFAKPQRLASQSLLLLYRKNTLSRARLGIMVSKKHVKTAVLRNRMRRILRESFRIHTIKHCGFDIVLLVRNAYTNKNINNRALKELSTALWQQLFASVSSSDSL